MTNHTINVIRNYYGPKTTHTKYVDNQGNIWAGTRNAATKMIAELNDALYITDNNESGRAEYTIS